MSLADQLERYKTDYLEELRARQSMLEWLSAYQEASPNCFQRELRGGHFTGSGWVVAPSEGAALLLHHRKLDKWLQPGGHADGDRDLEQVARREINEEAGLRDLSLLVEGIFDLDVHEIPAREKKGVREAEHLHFDVRFAFRCDKPEELQINSESFDGRWVKLNDIGQLTEERSILRLVEKTLALV